MTGLVDEVFAGSLTPDTLDDYTRTDPSFIDKPGGHRNITPLCAAIIAANIETVELLLLYQADPNAASPTDGRTPLQLATSRKLRANQAAIVAALLRAGADVNRGDSARGDNTPLINAIVQLRDETIVQLLVDYGADLKKTNARGRSAEEFAKIYGMGRCLRPRTERKTVTGYLVDLLVALVLFILALVNNGAVEGAVKGIITKLYQVTGTKNISATDQVGFEDLGQRLDSQDPTDLSRSGQKWVDKIIGRQGSPSLRPSNPAVTNKDSNPQPPQIQPAVVDSIPNNGPAPITEAKVEQAIGDFLEDNDLTKFFRPGDDFLKDLASSATALSKDVAQPIYAKPENVNRIAKLSLYQSVIYCDDSSSMLTENPTRYHYQTELVSRIARIATKIVPDTDDCRIELRFINDGCTSRLSANEIAKTMHRVHPNNITKIGTNLRSKILEPLVYRNLGPGRRFKRPILICTITDGCPVDEHEDTFRNAIIECRERLVTNGYESTAVKFLVSHVGNDPQAERFLAKLRSDALTKDMVYCTSHRLDEKFKELRAAEDQLEEWLLKTLTSPIMGWD